MVICRGYKRLPMKAHGHYYYHRECWDAKEEGEERENWITGKATLSSSLSTEQTSLVYGYVRLLSPADLSRGTICVVCHAEIIEK